MRIFLVPDYTDISYEIRRVLQEAYGNRAKLCPILGGFVKARNLGQETGRGFYEWSKGGPVISQTLSDKFDYHRG